MKCWRIQGKQWSNTRFTPGLDPFLPPFDVYQCHPDDLTVVTGTETARGYLYLSDGTSEASAELTISIASCSNCPGCCPGTPSETAHDCINGQCIPSGNFSTPGKYPSLVACNAGCNNNSSCDGECVSQSEIQALKQVANALQSKFCK
jgi:hypothetical protein